MTMFRLSTAWSSWNPPMPLPCDRVSELPVANTCLPASAAPCTAWVLSTLPDMAFIVVLSRSIPSTVLICASCEVTCALSTGLSGS